MMFRTMAKGSNLQFPRGTLAIVEILEPFEAARDHANFPPNSTNHFNIIIRITLLEYMVQMVVL